MCMIDVLGLQCNHDSKPPLDQYCLEITHTWTIHCSGVGGGGHNVKSKLSAIVCNMTARRKSIFYIFMSSVQPCVSDRC